MKKLLAASSLACLAVGFVASANLKSHLFWIPQNVEKYDFDLAQQATHKPVSRAVSEEVSKTVLRKIIGPVSGAVLMDEVLGAYHEVSSAQSKAAGLVAAVEILALWDDAGAADFATSLGEDFVASYVTLRDNALIKSRVGKARAARDFVRTMPERPDRDDAWYSYMGAKDPDAGAGSLPFSMSELMVPEAPPPLVFGSDADELDLRVVETATRIATIPQKRNSVFWQGSNSFAKGANNTGINPSDIWQTILFMESYDSSDEEEYVENAAELASVLRDAMISAWQVKYRDWTLRPSMRIPKLEAAIGNPSFPGYVSGHATIASAAAEFLAYKYPDSAEKYNELARDSYMSRMFGGVHTPSDNIIGAWLGREVAKAHLGIQPAPAPAVFWNAKAVSWSLNLATGALDATDWMKHVWEQQTSKDGLSFVRMEDAPPAPRAKSGPLTGNDTMKGSIAAADLNGDGLKDIMVAGYRSVRIYENQGSMRFELRQEVLTEELNGAYFTKDDTGRVDGMWAFGRSVPTWHKRDGDFLFSKEGVTVSGMPEEENYNIKGMIFTDLDDDGLDDAVFLNYDDIAVSDGLVILPGQGLRSHQALRTDDGFSYNGYFGTGIARAFAGGEIDLDGDGVDEMFVVNDGQPVTILDRDYPRDDNTAMSVAGMSWTPITVAGKQAVHVTNIFDGPSDIYKTMEDTTSRDRDIDGDILLSMKEGTLVDLAQTGLQSGPLEWSWGSQAGDMNGDGLEDLVIVYGFTPNLAFRCGVRIMLQQKDGTFKVSDTQIHIGDFYPRSILLTDLDNDGRLDIMMSSFNRAQVWRNTSKFKTAKGAQEDRLEVTGFLTQNINDDN